jgi:hypothetical protein
MNQALEWYQSIVNDIIDDDGIKQQVDLFKLIKSVESNLESAQIIIQLKEQELKKKGSEEGSTLRGVWIATALMLSPNVSSDTIRMISILAPSICVKAMNFIKENDLM